MSCRGRDRLAIAGDVIRAILRDVSAMLALSVGACVSLARWRDVYALAVVYPRIHIIT
nr:MAG TPA: hypothetical protein [Caudoviricetes sp.]